VERALPCTPIGLVEGRSRKLDVRGLFTIPLDELREAYSGTLPALFAGALIPAPAAEVVTEPDEVETEPDEPEAVEPAEVDPETTAPIDPADQ